MTEPPFRPDRILATLRHHGVRFVLIGGLAARARGSAIITADADICYARDERNLEALAVALRELGATLRGAPAQLPFKLDARTLRAGDHFTFATKHGPFDCLGTPAGTKGFDELDLEADEIEVEGVDVRVVSLDDLIRMKRAAGRTKDLLVLEDLGGLRDELEGRPEE